MAEILSKVFWEVKIVAIVASKGAVNIESRDLK